MIYKAVLFDMDGVLIRAKEIHRMCFNLACKAAGLHTEGREEELEGRPTMVKLQMLGATDEQTAAVSDLKQTLTKACAKGYPADLPRQRALRYCKQRGLKVACVTNSIRETTEMFLKSAELFDTLDLVVTTSDGLDPKPSPEPYIYAMCALGVHAEDTLIVEDSPVGLESATASGGVVIQVSSPDDVTEGLFENLLKGTFQV